MASYVKGQPTDFKKSAAAAGPYADQIPKRERKDVATRHRENLLAGLGVFELLSGLTLIGGAGYVGYVYAGWWWLPAVLVAFVGSGLFITGLLNFLRNAIDELRDSVAFVRQARDNARLQRENAALLKYALELEERLRTVHQVLNQKVVIQDNQGARTIDKYEPVDAMIAKFLTEQIFDAAGRFVGVHPNGQIKRAFPFKQGTGGANDAAYERSVRLGLVRRDERGNYLYRGPKHLADALALLR